MALGKAGHNQSSFIDGVRQSGPDIEGHFTSAIVVDNYDINPSGHLNRRKGLVDIGGISNLNGREILDVVPLNNKYFFLLKGNPIRDGFAHDNLFLLVGELLKPIRCHLTQIRKYDLSGDIINRSTMTTLNNMVRTLHSVNGIGAKDLFRHNNIIKLSRAGDFIWAFSESYFCPYIIKFNKDVLEVYPLYLENKNVDDYYPFLRSIPIEPLDVEFNSFVQSDRQYDRDIRLYIDKHSDLNVNQGWCWLGLDDPTQKPVGNMDIDKVGLRDFIGRPLFFNILPTEIERVDPNKDYDSGSDFTGTLLTNLEDKGGISNFEVPGSERRAFITELLYGRKYCIIPYGEVENELGSSPPTYENMFEETVSAQPALTTAMFNFEELLSEKTYPVQIPNTAKVNMAPLELKPKWESNLYSEGDFDSLGSSFVLDLDDPDINSRSSSSRLGISADVNKSGTTLNLYVYIVFNNFSRFDVKSGNDDVDLFDNIDGRYRIKFIMRGFFDPNDRRDEATLAFELPNGDHFDILDEGDFEGNDYEDEFEDWADDRGSDLIELVDWMVFKTHR